MIYHICYIKKAKIQQNEHSLTVLQYVLATKKFVVQIFLTLLYLKKQLKCIEWEGTSKLST